MKATKKWDINGMSTDEMWRLHVEVSQLLSVRLVSEKRELEKRLAQPCTSGESAVPQRKPASPRQNTSRERTQISTGAAKVPKIPTLNPPRLGLAGANQLHAG